MMRAKVIIAFAFLMFVGSCYGQSYTAEGYFVVDGSAVQNYVRAITTSESYATKYQRALVNIRNDLNYLITQVNVLYSSLSLNGLNIDIRIRRLDILTNSPINTFKAFTRNVVDTNVAIDAFTLWLATQNSYSSLQYDFAMLWTGYDLYGTSLMEYVVAKTASVCTSNSASVVELTPTYRDVVGTAKAIAYILGANNDGFVSTTVMAPVNTPNDANRWSFSSCTAASIKDVIRLLSVNCLLSTNAATTKPSVTYATYTGDLFNPDVICQRSLNDSRSFMCKDIQSVYGGLPPKGNGVCRQIYCKIPDTNICAPTYTSDGMPCDNQMRCTSGQCSSSSTPTLNSKCVWGDQASISMISPYYTGSCPTFISLYKSPYCYSVNVSCCATCQPYYTGIAGCEYGDKNADCTKYTKAAVCPSSRAVCCNYCRGYVGKRSPDVPLINLGSDLGAKFNSDNTVSYQEAASKLRV